MTGPGLPTVLARGSGPEACFTLAMDEDLLAFRGHFPGNPILPGVVQVDWAIRFGTEAFGDLGGFRGIDHLKFQGLVRPGEVLELRLGFDPGQGRLRFKYQAGSSGKSSGVVRFDRPGGARP
jgi:3-hydroxymyristoyl/3-hydroxydecanoyl-(acyl carrier protein) dehydratase